MGYQGLFSITLEEKQNDQKMDEQLPHPFHIYFLVCQKLSSKSLAS